jgi:hypothetical protein
MFKNDDKVRFCLCIGKHLDDVGVGELGMNGAFSPRTLKIFEEHLLRDALLDDRYLISLTISFFHTQNHSSRRERKVENCRELHVLCQDLTGEGRIVEVHCLMLLKKTLRGVVS